jgi:hypothetical protein
MNIITIYIMYTYKIGISLSIIGVAAVLMMVTAPTLENQQALAVTQSAVKKVNVKDPPSKAKKVFPPRKRIVKRCFIIHFWKHVCRWVPVHFRGPVVRPY